MVKHALFVTLLIITFLTVSGSYGTPTGTVTINDGTGASCKATLSGGSGSCALTSTTAGSKTLTASYLGDSKYKPSRGTTSYTVNIAPSSLTWNTFQGSASNDDYGYDIAVDGSGNIYVTGFSYATWGSPVNPYTGQYDAFVAKFNSSGALVWNTFMGSVSSDYGSGIAVDASGNVYVTGISNATWGSPMNPFAGQYDAFVARLNNSGVLVWNTFIGSENYDSGEDIVVDENGNIYVTGRSNATWGTPVNPFMGIMYDAFVARLNSSGALVWNTFMGSTNYDYGNGIAVDGSGNVYVTGYSGATWGSPVNPFSGGEDVFVTGLNSSGALVWNTFLGSASIDIGYGIVVDGSGNVYVTGYSYITWGSPVNPYLGGVEAFVAKLNSSGALIWTTFLGSANFNFGQRIAVDVRGNAFVTGTSYATWGTPVNPYSGGDDAFVAKLNSSGAMIWTTFLGSASDDSGDGIVVDGSENIYITGDSYATWGSPVNPFAGGVDAFVAKIPPFKFSISGNAGVAGATINYSGGSTTADGTGAYSISVAYNWSGTVTPSKAGYTFAPDHKNYTNVTVDQTGQDYIATINLYRIYLPLVIR